MKKRLLLFYFTFCIFHSAFPQAGEWVWLHGDSQNNNPGNFGTQGTPSPTNEPPSLYEACEWTDLSGNFWLFGGLRGGGIYNDLWKYDPFMNQWTWVKGPGVPFNSGSYGIQGIPSPTNIPPARGFGALSWGDSTGNFWLFGGGGSGGLWYSDLWKYDILTNEWTWMKGPNIPNQQGVYGIQGVPNISNNPRCRAETAAAWVDNSGDLWLFGGHPSGLDMLNDLWRYSITTNTWTWMKGSQFINQPGSWGSLGIEQASNTPDARFVYGRWKDPIGNFWILGGSPHNDLWRFNPNTNNWTWMNGDSTTISVGVNGSFCVPDISNKPNYTGEARAAWTDTNGNFWSYCAANGLYSALWSYNFASNRWSIIKADSLNGYGVWGTKGISSPCNIPPQVVGSIGWSDNNGSLYMFGGEAGGTFYNCLWKYTINPICTVVPCLPINIEEINLENRFQIYPNPTNSSFTISFSTSENQSMELRIYNTLGKQIYVEKEEITKGKFEKEIHVEKWSEGIYFLQVKMKEGVVSQKVVVNH